MRTGLEDKIDAIIDAHQAGLTEFRREIHRFPELSHAEFETTWKLAQRLTGLGLEVHVRHEGLGLFADATPAGFDPALHRTVAVRADIDALPIQEETGLPYASVVPNVMHACGHDMHVACVLGVATVAGELLDELPGRVRLLFQHGEEVAPGGAEDLVAIGCMEGVGAILALHCDPALPVGVVGVKDGSLTASADAFDLTIKGRGGHAARPHNCVDPVFVATQIAGGLYQTVGRSFDARDPAVISIGAVRAGDGYNVIPHTARLQGTVRTLSQKNRGLVDPLFRRIAQGICEIYGATFELHWVLGAPCIYNDPYVTSVVRAAVEQALGPASIHEMPLPSMGAEDFSYYLEEAPGAMIRVGTWGGGPGHFLHSPQFQPDERGIAIGARVLARAAVGLLHEPDE